MSNPVHKRSISGVNSSISSLIKVSKTNGQTKSNLVRNSLTPTRNEVQTNINHPSSQNFASYNNKISKVDFKSNESEKNKFPITTERLDKNKNSLFKSIINMPISTIKNISEVMNKKTNSSRPATSGANNIIKSYRDDKLKSKGVIDLSSTNSFDSNNEKIKVNRNSKSPSTRTNISGTQKLTPERNTNSKSPGNDRNSITKNSLLKRYEELKNRNISSSQNRGVIKLGESQNNPRGTVTFTNNVKKEDNKINRDNKFNNNLDFREMNTSPLLIRRKSDELKESTVGVKVNNQLSNRLSVTKSLLQNKMTNTKVDNYNSLPQKINKKIKSIYEISKVGYSGQGVKKVNQDNIFIYKNFMNEPQNIYLGVCDGHGMYGHDVSAFIRENLPVSMNTELSRIKDIDKRNSVIEQVFLSTNFRLFNESSIDTNFSGSTCVSVIYSPDKLLCANIGDSRAILGRCVNGVWSSHNLSRDHKPDVSDEAARIKKRGGRIEPYRDENNEYMGPARVWLKDEEIPGLAMSRSFGDEVAASVGIIAQPEITEWKFTAEDKFLIIASDGIWEFIESDECVSIVKDFFLKNDIKGACEYLVKESSSRWLREEEVIDDTTIIMLYLD